MGRPQNCRRVKYIPECDFYKPRGVPLSSCEILNLSLDELEAVRLADKEGLYQEKAAEHMNISRQTFGRILESAHRKIAEALVGGMALKIEGGKIDMTGKRVFKCVECSHTWELPYGTGRPQTCPECKSDDIHRVDHGRGRGMSKNARRNHAGCRQQSKGNNA